MVPRECGEEGKKTIDLFYGRDPTDKEGENISACFENININVEYSNSGLSTLYNAKRGKRFVFKNCNLYTKESNTTPGGGA